MRIRQVKPSFWTDVRIAELPAPVRLFYIGLWMQADDAGWFRWDPPQIGAELYGFEGRARRERNVCAFGDALESINRIERLDCGHAFIGRFVEHQRFSGPTKQVKTVQKEHQDVCLVTSRNSPRVPASPRPVRNRNGKEQEPERLGKELVAPARAPEGAADAMSDFDAEIAAAGGVSFRPRIVS